MWRYVYDCAENEASRGVLSALVNGLFRLWYVHPNEIADATVKIFERINDGPGARRVRKQCLETLLAIFIWKGNTLCQDILEAVINDPENKALDIEVIIAALRNTMNGALLKTSECNDIVVNRTWGMVKQITGNLARVFDKLPAEKNEVKQKLLCCMNDIAQQLFFASGAHKSKEKLEVVINSDNKKQFLNDAEETVELLIKYPHPSLIHHIVEMLEFLIEGDPQRVFLLIGEVIEESRQGLYHYESMGADITVSVIERYLAEYRHILREPDCEKILIRILDTFVKAGWTQARRLTYRLEEIYR
jgi:hypothetical protein